MPRSTWLAAFLATSVLFLIGASPAIPTASAGNCTSVWANTPYIHADGINVHGSPTFTGVVGGCTSVSLVQFSFPGISGGGTTFIQGNYGASWPVNYTWQAHPCACIAYQLDPSLAADGFTWEEYHANGPCSSFNTQWYGGFWYRIQSIDIHGVKTWGAWHGVVGSWATDHDCN